MKTADSLYTSQTVTGEDTIFQGHPSRVGFVEETEGPGPEPLYSALQNAFALALCLLRGQCCSNQQQSLASPSYELQPQRMSCLSN